MKQRIAQILGETTLDASGTKVIDLDVTDPVSKLLFEYKATRGSATVAGHIAGNLSKIELVDGSDVLFSLSGKQMDALAFYDTGRPGYRFLSNVATQQDIISLEYFFGRKLWDKALALDPKRFKNPQIKVTYSRVGADASASANTLKVLGFLFDEQPVSPVGFLMSKEIEAWTSGAENAYKYIDMPVDYAIRKLLVRGYADGYYPYQCANEIRLSENGDKRIPIDEKVSTLMKWINSNFPRFREQMGGQFSATAADIYVTPSFDITVNGTMSTQGGIFDQESEVLHDPFALGANGSYAGCVEISGHNPHAVVPLLFGDQDEIDDWYDVTQLAKLQARVKAGSAGTNGSMSLFAQQLRKY